MEPNMDRAFTVEGALHYYELALAPTEGPHHEDYCSWRCLAVRCEQQFVPGKNRPTGVK